MDDGLLVASESWSGTSEHHAPGDSLSAAALLSPLLAPAHHLLQSAAPTRVRLRARETIWRGGECADRALLIASGWAYRFHRLEDGSRQIVSFLLPGDVTPLAALVQPEAPVSYGVRTVTDVDAYSLDLAKVRALLLNSPRLMELLLQALLQQSEEVERRVTDLGVRSAPSRVAQLVLEIEAKLVSRGLARAHAFAFPIRQEDLARATGLTLVHLNRTLVQLRRHGYLDYSRGVMNILDPQGLRRLVAEVTTTFVRRTPGL